MSRFSNSITEECYSQITDFLKDADEKVLDQALESFQSVTYLQDWVRDFCNCTDGEDLDNCIYEEGFNTVCWGELKVALLLYVEAIYNKMAEEEEMLEAFNEAMDECSESEDEDEKKRRSIDTLLEGQKALNKLSS